MNNFKEMHNNIINNITDDMESKPIIINEYPTLDKYNYDLYISFYRKKIYWGPNGPFFYNDNSNYYCLPANTISNNYLNLSDYSIETDLGVSLFHSEFQEFYDSLSGKIYDYSSKRNEIKKSLLNIEAKTINKGYRLG